MNKQEQFLWIVQTTILANNIRLATEPSAVAPECDVQRSHQLAHFSATATYGLCSDALDASRRIPENLSAAEAAHQWLFWMLDNLRDEDAKIPEWFARS